MYKKRKHFSNACHNNGPHLILTTTKFVIQKGINQPCRTNTFLFMDHYVTKFEKLPCMILTLACVEAEQYAFEKGLNFFNTL